MISSVDLNADLGEGCANDLALLDIVTSANIACGGHAGDAETMLATITAAKERGVAIGAHPSFPDREHFGRVAMTRTPEQVYTDVRAQVETLWAVAEEVDAKLHHVKAHGALYNQAARDRITADAISRAVKDIGLDLAIVGLAGGAQIASARAHGLRAIEEIFADRRYRADGTLVPRSEPHALIEDEGEAVKQTMSMLREHTTICVHGDGPHALSLARAVKTALTTAGVAARAFVLILALLVIPHPALASASPKAQDVLATEAKWVNASMKGDAKTLDAVLGENWVHINYQGKILYREDALAMMKHPLPYKQMLSEQTVDFAGNAAIVHGLNTVTDKKGAVVLRLRYTDVYVFENGRWMAISAQETPVR